jgi:hypothetical protein
MSYGSKLKTCRLDKLNVLDYYSLSFVELCVNIQ